MPSDRVNQEIRAAERLSSANASGSREMHHRMPCAGWIELLESEDERVALMAADKVLERAWGKPKAPKDSDDPFAKLSPEARRSRILELLAYAASLQAPLGDPE